ncbi:Hypothetical protein NTJ_07583 [Nesidiocoris tenuis]|nr:Hypothetical protein NTJ_07583 [Nesidiocoris tenuis]
MVGFIILLTAFFTSHLQVLTWRDILKSKNFDVLSHQKFQREKHKETVPAFSRIRQIIATSPAYGHVQRPGEGLEKLKPGPGAALRPGCRAKAKFKAVKPQPKPELLLALVRTGG